MHIAVGFSVPMAPGSDFRSVYQRQENTTPNTKVNPYIANNNSNGNNNTEPHIPPPPAAIPPPPYAPPGNNNNDTNGSNSVPPPANGNSDGNNLPSYDDLAQRFAALRNNK